MRRGSLKSQEPDGSDLAAGGSLNGLGHLGRTGRFPLDHSIDPGPVGANFDGEGGDGNGEAFTEAHPSSITNVALKATMSDLGNVVFEATSFTLGDMDEIFPMREKLRDDVLVFRRTMNLTPAQMAVMLKRSPSGLHSTLYDSGRHVGLDLIQEWARVTGHSILEYIDDPGRPVPGVSQEAFGEATEEERVILRAVASDLAQLRPELRRPAFDAWTAIIRGFQAGER